MNTKKLLKEYLILESIKENTNIIKEFIIASCKKLGIDRPVKVKLIHNRTDKLDTYAKFNTETNEIFVYVKNRATADILRSIAHELKHLQQNTTNQDVDGTTGSKCENEANAFAGIMIREFGEKHPEIYEQY
jgi:Zn-dependent peptidase ImmA (M78 family)